jgi:hypothetical protein
MKHSILRTRLSFFAALLGLGSGCTHLANMAVQPTTLPAGQKLGLHAALVLNQDLADYKHEYHMMGDTWVFPFGPPLEEYARRVAGASFQQVDVAPSEHEAAAITSADLILIPRPVKADHSMGLTAASKVNFTLVVEWVAKDRGGQNTIWQRTITADASEKQGSVFTGKEHQRILMQKLFDDLSLKTHAAFEKSPELRGNLH